MTRGTGYEWETDKGKRRPPSRFAQPHPYQLVIDTILPVGQSVSQFVSRLGRSVRHYIYKQWQCRYLSQVWKESVSRSVSQSASSLVSLSISRSVSQSVIPVCWSSVHQSQFVSQQTQHTHTHTHTHTHHSNNKATEHNTVSLSAGRSVGHNIYKQWLGSVFITN